MMEIYGRILQFPLLLESTLGRAGLEYVLFGMDVFHSSLLVAMLNKR